MQNLQLHARKYNELFDVNYLFHVLTNLKHLQKITLKHRHLELMTDFHQFNSRLDSLNMNDLSLRYVTFYEKFKETVFEYNIKKERFILRIQVS